MSLIRNGSFERGDTEFWVMNTGESFDAATDEKKYGTYSGKLVTATGELGEVETLDFTAVKPHQTIDVSLQVMSSGTDLIYVYLEEYTEGHVFIRYHVMLVKTLSGAWTRYEAQDIVGAECAYVKLRIRQAASAGIRNLWIDAVCMEVLKPEDMVIRVMELCDINNATASGDTHTDLKWMLGYRSYYAEVDCTSLTGTNPTLDIDVCEFDQRGNERVLGCFTQIVGATDQRVGIALPIGRGVYVKYTEGGTWTDCDFEVRMIGVR